jgi:hypothetical protein
MSRRSLAALEARLRHGRLERKDLRTLSTSRVRMYSRYVHEVALLAPQSPEHLSGSHVHEKKKKKKVDSEHFSGSLVHEVALLAPQNPERLSGSHVLELCTCGSTPCTEHVPHADVGDAASESRTDGVSKPSRSAARSRDEDRGADRLKSHAWHKQCNAEGTQTSGTLRSSPGLME